MRTLKRKCQFDDFFRHWAHKNDICYSVEKGCHMILLSCHICCQSTDNTHCSNKRFYTCSCYLYAFLCWPIKVEKLFPCCFTFYVTNSPIVYSSIKMYSHQYISRNVHTRFVVDNSCFEWNPMLLDLVWWSGALCEIWINITIFSFEKKIFDNFFRALCSSLIVVMSEPNPQNIYV